MRFVIDLHFELGPPPDDEPEQHDSAVDTYLERRGEEDHRQPRIGFGREPEETT